MTNKNFYYITTSDGKTHQVSEDNIKKYGMSAYAEAYKDATLRMRDNDGEDYDIPLHHYDNAVGSGLHPFRYQHTEMTESEAGASGSRSQPQAAFAADGETEGAKVEVSRGTVAVGKAEEPWRPSVQEKIRMDYERRFGKNRIAKTGTDENGAPVYGMVHTPGTYDTERDMRRMVETGERLQEKYLQSGRDKRKAAEMQSRAAGMYTKPLGMISGASGEGDGVEVKSKETDNMPAQSPELYGVKYVDGKPVNEWLMPDGSLSTDFVKADNAESGARRQRLQDQFVSRMRENGLDPAKQEDVQRQAQLDYVAPISKAIDSAWAQAEADAREANKPRRSELLDVGNDFNAYDRALKENDAFDLDKMADKVMKSLPAQYRSRMVSDYMDYYSQHEEELNGRSVEQAAQDALKGEVYGMVYQRAVDAHMPESGYEFLMRKIADQPFSNVSQAMKIAASAANGSYGMASAEMDAMAQYGDQHRVLDITGTVLNMAVDPTTALSGAVGGAVGKEALQLGGKAMMRKVAKDRAGRALGSRLAGRVLAGVAGGSANMATFEMVKNAQGQLTLGGVVNPETGENEGYSLGSILHSGVHGAKMGAATGVVSPLIGNVADGLVKATSSTAGKMALRGGEVAVSKLFEGTIFAASEVYDVQKMPDDKFDLLYAEKYGYDSETDEAKRAEARQKAKNDMSWDAWDDSMAMMIGFGVTHGIKTAPGVIAELRPVKPRVDVSGREIPLTREERIHNRKRFVEHVRDMLDRSPSDIALTKEERAELRAKGYGKLSDLFVKDKKGVKEIKSDGSEVASGDLESGTIFESDALVKKGEYTSRKDFDTADGEFDGYEAMDLLMKDKRVSEAARAKLYYIMTGRMLPMSTVTGWNMARNEDGSITVNSMSQRGGIVTSRTFKTEKEANREIERIKRQAELNTIDVGEQYKEAEAQAFGRESAKPENIRKRLKDETGVDVDAVLRKEPRKRTFEEQEVLGRYAKELFPEADTSREAETSGSRPQHGAETKEENAPQAAFATDGETEETEAEASRGTETSAETEAPVEAETSASVDAETQAEMERISEWMHEAYQDVEDAFGADSVLWMEQIEQNPLAVLDNPEITEDQRAAVLNFMNAKAAMSGVEDASLEETARKRMYVEEEVKRRTHSGSGMIIPITTTDGRELYLVNGEVQMYEDGSRAKTSASDRSLVALDPKTGKCEIIAPESVKEMGEQIDPQAELQAAYDAIEAERAEALQNAQKDNGNNESEDIPEAPQDSSLRSEHNRNEGDINGHNSNEKEASAMDRIPKDAETGAPRFEEVDPETAWDALVEDKLESLADARLKAAEKELAKAQKLKNDEIEYFRHKSRKQEIDKLREDAQRAVDFWKSVKGVGEARAQEAARVEAERISEEKRAEEVRIAEEKRVEAERLEEERKAEAAWKEQKQRMNEKVRKTAEVVRDCPEAVEVLENTDPQNIWEVASWVLSVNKVVPRNEGVLKGFREMTGYKSGEQRKLVGLFAKAENGGKTLEKLAEDAMQELCNQYGIPYDNNEALNALLDVLQQCGTLGEIRSYIENNRIQQALDTYSNWRRYNDMTPEEETEYEDYMFQQEYGLSRAEYEEMDRQWREYVGDHIEDLAYNFDANEFYGNIADELAAASEAALNIENYGNRQREIAQDAERGDGSASRDESAGAGQVSGRGGELLHKTPSGDANSREANTHGGGFHAPVRDGGVASPSAVEADPSGGKGVDTYDDFKHNNVVRSDEKDDNGLSLVLSSDGTTTFGNIRRGEGIQPLPIKLSEGFNKVDSEGNNIGYGLEHIEAGHGKEIRAAGFRSVTDFVEFVSKGYERILIGNTRKNGTQTYLIEIQDAKSNTLFIELSKDGQYWTVNSGGVFRKNYTGKKKTVEPLPAVEASPVAADEKVQEQGDNPMSGNSSSTVSSGKVTNSASEKQEAGGKSSLGERISAAEAQVNTEPTEAQKKAGNYKMGHVQVGTFDVTIENPKGSVRRGTDANGKQWETTMSHTYGYIRGTESVDGDHIDVFLSSDIDGWDGRKVFVVDQYNPDGTFDEHKVMLGFNDRDDAFDAYLSNYEKGWEKGRRLDCTEVSLGDFEKWIESSKRKTKAFADYKQVKGNPEKTPQAAPAGDKVAQTLGSRPHNGVETEAEVPIKAEASGNGDAKFESEYGGALSESFGKYLQFKESRDYDEKEKCLDESWRLLGDLPKRVRSMSKGELDALERDLDALVEGQVKNENDWNAIRYVDWVKKQCGIPKRRRELAEERAFQEGLASAEELTALAPRMGKVSIEKFADKREGSARSGVYHDAERKAAVATDSYVLVVSGKDYSEDHAGQVVAGGKVLGNSFPNVTKVIPTSETLAWESGADFGLLEAKAEDALRRAEKLKNEGWVQVAVRLSDGTPVVVDAGMLRDFARGARHVGATSLEMHAIDNSNTKLLMARGEDGLALMINRLYDPKRPLYSLTLDGKDDSGRGAAGAGPLDIANEVAEGYRASRDYDDSWMSRSRDNRQPNLFDFDFSQGEQGTSGSRPQHSVEAGASGKAENGKTGIPTENGKTGMPEVKPKGEGQTKRDLFDFDFSQDKQETSVEQEASGSRPQRGIDDGTSSADSLLDEFAESYAGAAEEYAGLLENGTEAEIAEADSRIEAELSRYADLMTEALQSDGMDYADADRTARELMRRTVADVHVALGKTKHPDSYMRGLFKEGEAYAPQSKPEVPEGESDATERNPEAPEGKEAGQEEKAPQRYETAGGETIGYVSYGELPALKPGEMCYVERKFSSSGEFGLTGGEEIKSSDDVAYLFRSLENYSVEHTFAVLTKAGARPVVMHLGMGNEVSSIVNFSAVRAAYDAMGGADKIYFVHNHPSGNLMPSQPDNNLLATMRDAYPEGVVQDGIIMDTTSGEYCQFSPEKRMRKSSRPESGGEVNYPVHRFEKSAFTKGYKPTEDMRVAGAPFVTKIVSSLRLGQRDKQNILLCSNSLEVVGCFSLSETSDPEKMASEIISLATRFGGRRIVLFGNCPMDDSKFANLGRLVKEQSAQQVSMLDNVFVENGLNSEPEVVEAKASPKEEEAPAIPAKTSKSESEIVTAPVQVKNSGMIDDFGEKIAGARKDILKDLASTLGDSTIEAFVSLPLAKAFKRPNVGKLVEQGALSAEEGKVVEALSLAISGDSKPVVGRSARSRRSGGMTSRETELMKAWAERQVGRVDFLRRYLSADEQGREAMIKEIVDKFDRGEFPVIQDSYGRKERVMPSDALMVKLLSEVELDPAMKISAINTNVYSSAVSWNLRTGKSTYVRIGENAEEAYAYMKTLFMLKNGLGEVELPKRMFHKKVLEYEMVPTGGYSVLYINGKNIVTKDFGSKSEADEFCKRFKSADEYRMREKMKHGEPVRVRLEVIDPIKNEYVPLEREYGSMSEAGEALDGSFEEVNKQAVEKILENNKINRNANRFFKVQKFMPVGGQPGEWGVVVSKGRFGNIISSHPTEAEAVAAADKLETQRREYLKKQREIPYFKKGAERQGKDYRKGKDATPEMFMDAFGFRGVQFGNWTNQTDRQAALNQAYDALHDLAVVTGLSPRALSLNGELGLAFGARGSGSALAHYEPSEVVINLTKTRGEGSLAHEWWHALDNYFGRSQGLKGGYATMMGFPKAGRAELAGAFKALVDAVKKSDYAQRSGERGAYWGSTEELTARLFAEWVDKALASKGERSPFLSRGVDTELLEEIREMNWTLYKLETATMNYFNKERKVPVMTREEFMNSPRSLRNFVEVTEKELAEFEPLLSGLFSTMKEREADGKTEIYEPEVVYGDEAGIGQKFVEVRDEGVRYRDEEEMPDGERTDDGADGDTDAKEKHVVQLGSKLNTPVRIIRSEEEVKALPTRRDQRAKGWWDGRTGEVVVVLPNNADVADVKNTVVHEVVGHKGLRAFIGEERFDAFLGEVYSHAEDSIRKRIDALTDRMVNAEAERLHEEKRKAHEEAGRDSNAPYIPDMAEARVEAERKREEFRKEATEEYMADLGGRIGDEGFEKMSREELTFWGTIKAKVQQFLDKFLQGLKIAKSIRLNDKDLSYILFRSWKHAQEGKSSLRSNHNKTGIFAEAEDVAKRIGTRFADGMKNPSWKEKARALTDTKKSPEGKTVAPEDSLSHAEAPRYVPSLPKISDTKIVTISENLKSLEEKIPQNGLGKNQIIFEIAQSVGISGDSSKSNYNKVDIPGVGGTTIRISNHSSNPSNFGATDNNVGIVIKTSNYNFREKDDVDYVEFMYYGDKVAGDGERQRRIVEGLRHYIETGDFGKMPEPDRLNTSGAYSAALEGLGDVIRYRDPDMGLEETITKMKTDAMQANADNLQAKKDAMRAIGGNLSKLRQAMARQKEYDITTVKSVSDLARILLDAGLLDDLSKFETKRILGAINSVVGKQDVSQYVQKVMDIMVDNQLRLGSNTLGKLLSVRGSRVDARGIEVQGVLDPEGQRIAQVVKKSLSLSKDDINNRISEALNRMGNSDTTIADEAAMEYSGLLIAHRYAEEITESKAEEKELRDSIKQAKEDKDAGQMTEVAYKQYIEATNDAIRQNKIDRAEAFQSLVEQIGDVMSGSVERAKAWREAEKQRVEEIHHNANSDMKGRVTDEHHQDSRVQKVVNNSAVRFLLAPLATFDQMLRMFGKKNTRGEGYLWNRYMRGWVEATEKEYTGYRDALKVLDAKVSEVFGKEMTWGDLFSIDRKLPRSTVSFMDGGQMKEHELTQGNLLYIYMADKMSDGRMKLRKMGITEEDVADIKDSLDPRFIELADWMQDEFLVDKRNEYNEVHKRMFGASMAAIENYFPLKILANARMEDVDVADDTTDTALPATSTGSIIKRRRNNLALDVTGANAFSVILDHLQQMERWASFAEFNRDLNTLLSYKRFRNQVMNMSSAYGAGKTLWNNFRNVCAMAAGAYRPPIAALDKSAVNIAKGVTAAKVSFRVFTALKQFLSFPAYISDSNPVYLASNVLKAPVAWNWAMENLPLFEKRWKSKMAGDPRLMKTDMDWKMWRSRVVELASRVGMSPNAFVDALTVAIGARSMYQTKLAKYKRQGYDPEEAEKRAKQDATILFNQTQQSSEGAFLSTMQVDRSWLSVLFTVFRNSSMSYTRQLYDAIRNIEHRFTPGYKGLSEEFMAKQMKRDGIDPDKADSNAKQEYRRGIIRDIVKVGIFGYFLQFAWNLGAYLPYLILGDDEEEKDKMMKDAIDHAMFGSIEGLTGGDVMSSAGNMLLSGEGNPAYLTKDMPLASDVLSTLKKMGDDQVSALNDVINLCVQSGLGFNPQSLTDAVTAVIDYCGDDAQTSRECALLIARVLNCPPSQLEKIYFDELDMDGDEARKLTPAQIAERYADYKMMREASLTGWMRSDEEREAVKQKKMKRMLSVAKEKLQGRMATEETKRVMAVYDSLSDQEKEINKLREDDRKAWIEARGQFIRENDMARYNRVKRYKKQIDKLTKQLLKSKDRQECDSLTQAMMKARDEMLESLAAQ